MAEEDEDRFAFLIQSCHITPAQVTTLRTCPFFLESEHFHDSATPCPFPCSSAIQQPAAAAGPSLNQEEEKDEEEEEESIPGIQSAECSLNQEDSVPEQVEEDSDHILLSSDYLLSDQEEEEEEEEEKEEEEEEDVFTKKKVSAGEKRKEVCAVGGEILKEQLSSVKVSAKVMEKVKLFKEAVCSQEDNVNRARVCENQELTGEKSNADVAVVGEIGGCIKKRKLPISMTSEWVWGVNKMGGRSSREANARNKEVEIVEIE